MTDLARKLGIVPGCSVALVDAPAPAVTLLRDACPSGVTPAELAENNERYDLIFLWPRTVAGLAERFAALQWRIVPSGAIWVILAKKPVARRRGITFTWDDVQAAALQTDLVDNKIAAFSQEEYGTRFVIRRERRPSYAPGR
ncbi:MAG TPA: hypothetical protein VF040_14185 [Ktedonobacterales bacterium]